MRPCRLPLLSGGLWLLLGGAAGLQQQARDTSEGGRSSTREHRPAWRRREQPQGPYVKPPAPNTSDATLEAIVIPTVTLTTCLKQRLYALLRSMGPRRHLWVLHDADPPIPNDTLMEELVSAGLRMELKPSRRHVGRWGRLAGQRSGATKAQFMFWSAAHAEEYRYIWHIEDDTFFTGPWNVLFDAFNSTSADLLSRMDTLASTDHENHHRMKACRVASGAACDTVFKYKVSWPAIRLSQRFVKAMDFALNRAHACGHHELLAASICSEFAEWCTMASLQDVRQDLLGPFGLGGSGAFMSPKSIGDCSSNHCRMMKSAGLTSDGKMCGRACCSLKRIARLSKDRVIQPYKLMHPLKCNADACGDPELGNESIAWSLGEDVGGIGLIDFSLGRYYPQ